MHSKRVLIIDDEAPIREVMQSYLGVHGLSVSAAGTAFEGLTLARRDPPHLVILDILLPDLDGFELLSLLKKSRPQLPILIITGSSFEAEVQEKARLLGASDCINKTLPLDQLVARVESLLAPGNGILPNSGDFAGIEEVIAYSKRTSAFDAAELVLDENSFDLTAKVVSRVLATFNPNLGNNAIRSVALSQAVARILKMPDKQLQTLSWAAALHDVGLLALDSKLARKWLMTPGRCSTEELELIQRHPREAQRMLEASPTLKRVGDIIGAHHEHWDGSGFPDRLAGEAIPWLSRLLSVVVYYCNKLSPTPALISEIRAQAEKRFDTKAIEAVALAVSSVKLPLGEREVLISDLAPGMRLAADIRNKEKILILGAGRELTNAWINKILNLRAVQSLPELALIHC